MTRTSIGTGQTIAVVPARGGSKRIPRKNIRPIAGVPLITRTLATLVGNPQFDRVIVSTDDDEIASIAEAAGAEVPFRRPADLADDNAPTKPVVEHAIRTIEAMTGEKLGDVCSVYPASIFITPEDLTASRRYLDDERVSFVVAATSFPYPIQRAFTVRDGLLSMMNPEVVLTRSQDLEATYHDAGQFYWGRRDAWLTDQALLGPTSAAFVMPRWRVHDIDTLDDWHLVEQLVRSLRDGGQLPE